MIRKEHSYRDSLKPGPLAAISSQTGTKSFSRINSWDIANLGELISPSHRRTHRTLLCDDLIAAGHLWKSPFTAI